jgi:hypothetical protein
MTFIWLSIFFLSITSVALQLIQLLFKTSYTPPLQKQKERNRELQPPPKEPPIPERKTKKLDPEELRAKIAQRQTNSRALSWQHSGYTNQHEAVQLGYERSTQKVQTIQAIRQQGGIDYSTIPMSPEQVNAALIAQLDAQRQTSQSMTRIIPKKG